MLVVIFAQLQSFHTKFQNIEKKIMVDMMKKMMMMAMSILTVIVVDSSSLISDSCLNLTEWTVGIHSGKVDPSRRRRKKRPTYNLHCSTI